MPGWCVEKAGIVVQELEELHRLLAQQALPREVAERVKDHLGVAMQNATKLVSYGSTKEWTTDDAGFILKHGRDGYRVYANRHGFLNDSLRRRDLDTFIEDLQGLLVPEDRTNRTLVHELVRKVPSSLANESLVVAVADHVERVSQGEIEWHEAVDLMRTAIQAWNNKLDNEMAQLPTPPSKWAEVDADKSGPSV
jgi:hypothetical protein